MIILFEGIVLFCGTSCTDRKVHEYNAEIIYYSKSESGKSIFWHPERKSLFWIKTNLNELCEYFPSNGIHNTWKFDSSIGCIVPETKTSLIISLENKIFRFNLIDCAQEIFAIIHDENMKLHCNDGKCSPNGKLWIGTSSPDFEKNTGNAYCIHPDGSVNKMFKGLTETNGLVWSNDFEFMYHVDSPGNLVKRYRYDIKTEEVIHNGTAISISKKTGIPEGILVDKNGNLWIPQRGGFGVYCYNPFTGQLIAKVNIPVPNATSCTFGGENLDTLFITTTRKGLTEKELENYPLSGSIFACKIEPIGIETFYFGKKNY